MFSFQSALRLVFGIFALALLAPFCAVAPPLAAAPFPNELPHDDALYPPEAAGLAGLRGLSQYMAGHIAVGVMLPESDGHRDPDLATWSPEQITQIEQQVQAALDWWALRLPLARLSFSVEVQLLPTGYEPVLHTQADEQLWIADALGRRGYSGHYFDMAYAAAEQLRQETQSDWATLLFVANSAADDDGRFRDGRFAYAYIGGPMTVMTSDAGPYGANQFGAVFAHEFAHIFGALDQYVEAGIDCDRRSGYLNAPTSNSMLGNCPLNQPSIMREISNSYRNGFVDPAALAQVGYFDSDDDGLIDPLDTTPLIALETTGLANAGRPLVSGTVIDEAFPSSGQLPVSLNTVQSLEFRTNAGEWQAIPALDGAYDAVEEAFSFELPLYDGDYRVEFRACNEAGLFSESLRMDLTVTGIGPQPDYTVELLMHEPAGTHLKIAAPDGTQAVQISDDPLFTAAEWQAPADEMNYQPSPDTDMLFIRFRDAAGLVSLVYCQKLPEQAAPQPIEPATPPPDPIYQVFLPLLSAGS
jgi:hypothetical protein